MELTIEASVALVRLNRPSVHNAIDAETIAQLEKEIPQILENPSIRVIVLTGTGKKSFCSGGDLAYFASLDSREKVMEMSSRMTSLLDALWLGEKYVIAAINGDAFGGGCEVLTAAHLRIARSGALFCFKQAQNGIITGWGGGARLFRILNPSRALYWLSTSRLVTAQEAEAVGFLQGVVPYESLEPLVRRIAGEIATIPENAFQAAMSLHRAYLESGFQAARAVEKRVFPELWMGEPFQQVLRQYKKSGNS